MTRNRKLYFPNLNGLRCIAACFVIINHTEQFKYFYGIGDGVLSPSVKNIGKLGVMLFFVLSGFLITSLLLSEERIFGTIHTKKFYIRRLLRITPLYLLLIFLVFFVIQHVSFLEIPRMRNPIEENFTTIVVLHLFFLPNLTTAIYGFLPYIAQAWSIGTEEQSYLLWPLLLKRCKKNRLILMAGIILFYVLIRIVLKLFFLTVPHYEIIAKFWRHFNIDAIATGGIFAVLLFKKHRILKFVVHQKTFYITLTGVSILLLSGHRSLFSLSCLFRFIWYYHYQFSSKYTLKKSAGRIDASLFRPNLIRNIYVPFYSNDFGTHVSIEI